MLKKYSWVFRYKNGYFGYRLTYFKNGNRKDIKHIKNAHGEYFTTITEASNARALEKAKIETDLGELYKIPNKTVDQIWEDFLKCDNKQKASTRKKHCAVYNHHIKPVFGKRQVSTLSAKEINEFIYNLYTKGDGYNKDYDSGYSFKYCEAFVKWFYLFFGYAHAKSYVTTEQYTRMLVNKNEKIKLEPDINDGTHSNSIEVFQPEELGLLAHIFKDSDYELAFYIGYYCGLRISECFGLTWDDINLKKKTLTIDKQMIYMDSIIHLSSLKTKKAYRTITIPDELLKIIQDRHKYLKSMQKQYQLNWIKNRGFMIDERNKTNNTKLVPCVDFVFRDEKGKIKTADGFKYYSKELKKYGIHFYYHKLRHTHLSNLAHAGCPVSELRLRAGHSRESTTFQYYIGSTDESKRLLNLAIEQSPKVVPITEERYNQILKQKQENDKHEHFDSFYK